MPVVRCRISRSIPSGPIAGSKPRYGNWWPTCPPRHATGYRCWWWSKGPEVAGRGASGHAYRYDESGSDGWIEIQDPGKGLFGRFEDFADTDTDGSDGIWAAAFDRHGHALDLPGGEPNGPAPDFRVRETTVTEIVETIRAALTEYLDSVDVRVRVRSARHLPDTAEAQSSPIRGRLLVPVELGDIRAAETLICYVPETVADQDDLYDDVASAVEHFGQQRDARGSVAMVGLFTFDLTTAPTESWARILEYRVRHDSAELIRLATECNDIRKSAANRPDRPAVHLVGRGEGGDVVLAATAEPDFAGEFDSVEAEPGWDVLQVAPVALPSEADVLAGFALLDLEQAGDDPRAVASVWDEAGPAKQALLVLAPERIADLAGIPFDTRHQAQMILFGRELAEARAAAITEGDAAAYRAMRYREEMVRVLNLASRWAHRLPGQELLRVLAMAGTDGATHCVGIGSIAFAQRLVVHVWGGRSTPETLEAGLQRAVDHHQELSVADPERLTAALVWQGREVDGPVSDLVDLIRYRMYYAETTGIEMPGIHLVGHGIGEILVPAALLDTRLLSYFDRFVPSAPETEDSVPELEPAAAEFLEASDPDEPRGAPDHSTVSSEADPPGSPSETVPGLPGDRLVELRDIVRDERRSARRRLDVMFGPRTVADIVRPGSALRAQWAGELARERAILAGRLGISADELTVNVRVRQVLAESEESPWLAEAT